MSDDEARKVWWARHTPQSTDAPPEAETIAESLSEGAQRAILEGDPWAIEMDQAIAWELELLDLLEEGKISLNTLGLWVMRSLMRWDADYAQRQERFSAWFDQFYSSAYKTAAPGHAVTHAALFLHPDAHDAICDIAAKVHASGVVVGHPDDRKLAAYLAEREMVVVQPTSGKFNAPLRVQATTLGLSVAKLYRIERQERLRIFKDARQSAVSAERDKSLSRSMDRMTTILGTHLGIEAARG